MCKKFQLKGCIYEPGSNIPLNWRDMRSKFGYKLLCNMPILKQVSHMKTILIDPAITNDIKSAC
ncbi:hypothetical protein C5S31_10680 [ANME-1 cluster archaeon GoMg2]|nr:hypothetical protein [ANME-1 cluster archaeon GoMg2]